MDLSFIVAVAEQAAEPEKSKVPFYIAGGLLAAFAVVISVFGFTRPDYPSTVVGQRVVMMVSAIMVLGAVSMAIYTS